jgi:hypothetical protein
VRNQTGILSRNRARNLPVLDYFLINLQHLNGQQDARLILEAQG